ncbi:FAD-binding oxidoreductase [Sulfuracidifex tepidarius]|uniref:FAD-binding PCMH-type domain-containing protein n=1 Tax=Sulfuracidifex tepidarius TaxID=1294262 RepID=A0A510E5V3_9CREN|nr:FAD-binding oxidoreductase [Sulfuracidifex tepidarius]BBG25135.1 hypothetical protein IC006_2470 [Sulfuracidifex tepidarius]BBG27922.1 hypothetical protein IC007_2477 [Sulfuracidifex tepidarius]
MEDRLSAVKGLDKEVGKLPDVVAYPRSEEDVVKIVEVALQEHVPLVPRGGGVSSARGIYVTLGGVMIDMRNMDKIESRKMEVIVDAGARYKFNARVYPTLWKYATVGGNFCGGSWGIGSLEYGISWDQVTEVRMVNPKGKLVTLRGGDVKVAAHAEGTTGIVTKLRVMTRENLPIESRVVTFNEFKEASSFTVKLYEELPPLYHMVLRSPEISRMTVGPEKWHLVLAWEKDKDVDVKGSDGTFLWENRDRFFAGAYRENFESYDYTTYHLPLREFSGVVMESSKFDPVIEVEFANDFKAHLDFMVRGRETMESLKRFLGKSTFDVDDVYLNSRLSRDHLQKILWYKRAYDKEDLFNPGKVKF